MTEATRIRRNTFFSLLSITSRLIANVVLFWVIARYYGPVTFGQFTFANTLAFIFINFADFGFDVLLTNEIARNRNKANQIFQQFFSLKCIFTIVALVGMWSFALIKDLALQSRILVLIFSLYMVFTTFINFLSALYKGFERLEIETKVSLFINVSLLILIVLLILLKANIILIAGAFVFTRVLGFSVGIKYTRILLKSISFKLIFTGFAEVKNKVFIFGFHLLFNYLLFQLDTILLAFWKGDYDVGIYQSVFKFILIPLVIPDILTNTLTPVLSRFNVENKLLWNKVAHVMSKILLIIALPISIILFVYPEQIINFIYGGKNYSNSIPILRIFSLIVFLRFNFETFALILTTSDRQKIRMNIVIVATILNVVLNFIMIPIYGAFGAAVISLITNLFVGIMYYIFTLHLVSKWAINFKTSSIFIVGIATTYLFWHFRKMTIFIGAPAIIIIFIIIAYTYFFTEEEKKNIVPFEIKANLFKVKT
jgi:O-antigen/teichoic acid export membrane protein